MQIKINREIVYAMNRQYGYEFTAFGLKHSPASPMVYSLMGPLCEHSYRYRTALEITIEELNRNKENRPNPHIPQYAEIVTEETDRCYSTTMAAQKFNVLSMNNYNDYNPHHKLISAVALEEEERLQQSPICEISSTGAGVSRVYRRNTLYAVFNRLMDPSNFKGYDVKSQIQVKGKTYTYVILPSFFHKQILKNMERDAA